MDQVPSPPLVSAEPKWKLKIKGYPHFDARISPENVCKLVTNPEMVARNKFYPFMRYTQRWQPYRGSRAVTGAGAKTRKKPDKKERPIRFASRRDAYILSYYRHLLSIPYEKILLDFGLEKAVIAYRRIGDDDGGGKSNVEFARDAFDHVRELGNCAAVALDISSFFESLDHARLEQQWLRVIGEAQMPPDHSAVFRAVTRYAVVDREAVYERLGFLKPATKHGVTRLIYTVSYDDMPKKLCSNKDFQQKVCGRGGKYKSLIDVNKKPYGVPQGSPLSDMLANIYLIDFDQTILSYCSNKGGFYYRYSDDILMIVPGGDTEAREACDFAKSEIAKYGDKLLIKNKKTSAVVYENAKGGQTYKLVAGELGKNGLEYLGFRYDGKQVWIRDATISKLYRKVSGSIKAGCAALVRRYPKEDAAFLIGKFNYSTFFQRYGRVSDFDPHSDYRKWTFWTYARKSMKSFGKAGRPIPHQLKNYKKIVKARVQREIFRQLARREQHSSRGLVT